jgi:hypothetical protein
VTKLAVIALVEPFFPLVESSQIESNFYIFDLESNLEVVYSIRTNTNCIEFDSIRFDRSSTFDTAKGANVLAYIYSVIEQQNWRSR